MNRFKKRRNWQPSRGSRCQFETLETRRVLTNEIRVALEESVLSIQGTEQSDTAIVSLENGLLSIQGNSTVFHFPSEGVSEIRFNGGPGSDLFENATGIPSEARGGTGADELIGGSAADRLYGHGGEDRLQGRGGDDILDGGDDNDHFKFAGEWRGSDTIRDASGIDTLDFSESSWAASIDLSDAGLQIVTEVESSVPFWQNPDDRFDVNADESMSAIDALLVINDLNRTGSRQLPLYSDKGADVFFDVSGDSFVSAVDPLLVINRLNGSTSELPQPESEVRYVQEHAAIRLGNAIIENVIGSPFDDVLAGNDSANILDGRSGDDQLLGAGGNDVILAGPGEDESMGGSGQDTFRIEAKDSGTLTIYASADSGGDILDLSAYSTGVTVDLQVIEELQAVAPNLSLVFWNGDSSTDSAVPITTVIGSDFDDTLAGNELSNDLFGGFGNDTLIGRENADMLVGGPGQDVLLGGGGIDLIEGGNDNDRLDGGAGDDKLVFAGSNLGLDRIHYQADAGEDLLDFAEFEAAITLDLANTGQAQTVAPGDLRLRIDARAAALHVKGSMYDDIIVGGPFANRLYGLAGRDQLRGSFGNDVLFGGADDDQLFGDVGDDWLNGEAGGDTLLGGTGSDRYVFSGTELGNERIVGEAHFLDTDTIDFSALEQSVNIDLQLNNISQAIGDRGTLTLVSDPLVIPSNPPQVLPNESAAIENIVGTRFSDELIGNRTNNHLEGRDGNDQLEGNAGHDVLDGGAGEDGISGDSGDDRLLGGDGGDTLVGGSGDDSYHFQAGDRGHDRIHEKQNVDFDTLDFTEFDRPVVLDSSLNQILQSIASESFLTLISEVYSIPTNPPIFYPHLSAAVEQVIGSSLDDRIAGNPRNNEIDGREGNDVISGAGGADILLGGPGYDELEGGTGNDHLEGQADVDELTGGDGDDTYFFGSGDLGTDFVVEMHDGGDDTLDFFDHEAPLDLTLLPNNHLQEVSDDLSLMLIADMYFIQQSDPHSPIPVPGINNAIEQVKGTRFDDNITGNWLDNILRGRKGADTIKGNAGDDQIFGEEGEDILYGDAGEDRVHGGEHDDTIYGGDQNDLLHGYTGDNLFPDYRNDPLDIACFTIIQGELLIEECEIVFPQKDAVYASGGKLFIFGTDQADQVSIRNFGSSYRVELNGDRSTFPTTDVHEIFFKGLDGDDFFHNQTSLPATMLGGEGNDTLLAGDGDDTVHGGGGNDYLDGAGGSDDLRGGSDHDIIWGGSGENKLKGGSSNSPSQRDILFQESSTDSVENGWVVDKTRNSDDYQDYLTELFVNFVDQHGLVLELKNSIYDDPSVGFEGEVDIPNRDFVGLNEKLTANQNLASDLNLADVRKGAGDSVLRTSFALATAAQEGNYNNTYRFLKALLSTFNGDQPSRHPESKVGTEDVNPNFSRDQFAGALNGIFFAWEFGKQENHQDIRDLARKLVRKYVKALHINAGVLSSEGDTEFSTILPPQALMLEDLAFEMGIGFSFESYMGDMLTFYIDHAIETLIDPIKDQLYDEILEALGKPTIKIPPLETTISGCAGVSINGKCYGKTFSEKLSFYGGSTHKLPMNLRHQLANTITNTLIPTDILKLFRVARQAENLVEEVINDKKSIVYDMLEDVGVPGQKCLAGICLDVRASLTELVFAPTIWMSPFKSILDPIIDRFFSTSRVLWFNASFLQMAASYQGKNPSQYWGLQFGLLPHIWLDAKHPIEAELTGLLRDLAQSTLKNHRNGLLDFVAHELSTNHGEYGSTRSWVMNSWPREFEHVSSMWERSEEQQETAFDGDHQGKHAAIDFLFLYALVRF